ncbi:MAG: type 4a pilus biogenesis protein PilO [Candidatus Omnitrophica bacterium]|nr:type 4a pilus biogenesis protein PilO [Candidatus Omnitrophota bacterium]
MQKLNIDKQTLIFSIWVAVLVLELFLLLPFSIGRIVILNKSIAALERDLINVQREWPRKEEYIERKQNLESDIANLNSKFTQSREVSKLLSFISSSSKEFAIEVQAVSPGKLTDYPGSEAGEYQYLPINIKAKGQYHNLGRFFDFLQRSEYFFEGKELNMYYDYPYNNLEIIFSYLIKQENVQEE